MSCLFCCCCCCPCCFKRKWRKRIHAKKLRESDLMEFEPSDPRYKTPPNSQNPKNTPKQFKSSTPTPSATPTTLEKEERSGEYDTFEAYREALSTPTEELNYANKNIWDNPYTKEEFSMYLDKQLRGRNVGLQREFDALQTMKPKFESDEAKTMENRKKNRADFDFIPYDLNRVVLIKESNYINASLIQGYYRHKLIYIVTQLPMVSTLGDFWEMIWEENVRCIVNITAEDTQTVFWPKKGSEQVFGEVVRVKTMNEHIEEWVEERSYVLSLEEDNTKSHLVNQVEFKTDVEDMECPQACQILLYMVHMITEIIDNKVANSKLCFVAKSCNSLIGILISLTEVMSISENSPFSIYQTVEYLLSQRCGIITSYEHYKLLYLTVLELIQDLKPMEIENIVSLDVGEIDQESDEVNPVKLEFEKLDFFCKKAYLSKPSDTARDPINKKQMINTYAYDVNRVKVEQSPTPTDYINASYMHLDTGQCPVIAMAHPTKNSVKEFLWLIINMDIDMVMVLGKNEEIQMMNEGITQSLSYWEPLSGGKMYGEFRVERSKPSRHKGMLRYNIKVLYEPVKMEHREKTFLICLYRDWDENDLPTNNTGFLRVVEYVEEFRCSEDGKNPIVIQSIDGCTKVGIMLAVMSEYHKAKGKEALDLPQVVKKLRADRMSMINSREEYQKCYQLLIELANTTA